jgi:hypothetical protein
VNATGGAVLTVGDTRDLFTADYQRSVGQLFGRETPTLTRTDILGAGYRRTVRTGFDADARVQQAWSEEVGGRALGVRSSEGSVAMIYGLRSGLALSARAFLRRRASERTLVSHGVTVGVGYGWSQLRSMPAQSELDVR